MGHVFPGQSIESVSRALEVSMDSLYSHNAFCSLLSMISKVLLRRSRHKNQISRTGRLASGWLDQSRFLVLVLRLFVV